MYKNTGYPCYEIKNVFAEDEERNTLTAIPANTEFTAYGYLGQIAALEGTDYGTVILAAYDEYGTLVDVDIKEITNPEYLPCSYTVSMRSDDRAIGSIKVFVWDSLNSMIPLAETKTLIFTE